MYGWGPGTSGGRRAQEGSSSPAAAPAEARRAAAELQQLARERLEESQHSGFHQGELQMLQQPRAAKHQHKRTRKPHHAGPVTLHHQPPAHRSVVSRSSRPLPSMTSCTPSAGRGGGGGGQRRLVGKLSALSAGSTPGAALPVARRGKDTAYNARQSLRLCWAHRAGANAVITTVPAPEHPAHPLGTRQCPHPLQH